MFEETYRLKIEPRLPGEPEVAPGESTGDPRLDARIDAMLRETDRILDREYVADVRKDLLEIFRTPVGNILFRSIRHWDVIVKISPYDGSQGKCNAFQETDSISDAGVITPRVRYSPKVFGSGSPCAALSNPGQRAATLFHELVHAFRTVTTSSHHSYTYPLLSGGLYHYDDFEEFIAVMVTNIYVSGPRNPHPLPLSADHRALQRLSPELADSFRFFASGSGTFHYVDRFCKENPWFTKALSEVGARFNPLMAYYKDRHRAEGYSRGRYAIERDADGYDDRVFGNIVKSHDQARR
jgi:hypothetical protein